MKSINWNLLIMSILQIGGGIALLATQSHNPELANLGMVLIGSGLGQNLPSPLQKKP